MNNELATMDDYATNNVKTELNQTPPRIDYYKGTKNLNLAYPVP
jgi:hypothetical protein